MREQYIEQGKWSGLLIPSALFFGALGLYALQWYIGYGGGIANIFGDVTATAAQRVQAGDIPYRDFWTMYAPGSYYLLALLFSIFGHHILVGSIASSILCAAAVSLCYNLVYRLVGGVLPALAAAGIFLSAIYATPYYLNLGPYPPVIACILIALNLMARFHQTRAMAGLFAAGLATGLAIVFKHDVGGYAAIAMTAGLVAGHYTGVAGRQTGLSGLLASFAVFSIGVAVIALPVAGYFAVMAGVDMWRDLIVFPATDFRLARGEKYPGLIPSGIYHDWWVQMVFNFLEYLKFTIPFIVVVLTTGMLIYTGMRKQYDYIPMGITFIVLYLLHYLSAHVQINTNIISMPLYAAMLGAIGYRLHERNAAGSRLALIRMFALMVAAGSLLVFSAEPLYKRVRNIQPAEELVLPGIEGIRVPQDINDTLTELVTYFDENVPADQRIFIGLHRHDTIVIGDGMMYFILDRLNATRQDQLHPGVADTAEIHREMIRDLQAHDVQYLLLKHIFRDDQLDRLRKIWSVLLPKSGSTELDEYIRANYTRIRTIDRYEIWRKIEAGGVPAL